MKLRNIGSDQSELVLESGERIFFSYETPVAGFINEIGWFYTEDYHSRTTSKHINSYFENAEKKSKACQLRQDVIVKYIRRPRIRIF